MFAGLILTAAVLMPSAGPDGGPPLPEIPVPGYLPPLKSSAPADQPPAAPAAKPAGEQPRAAADAAKPAAPPAAKQPPKDTHLGPPADWWGEGDFARYRLKPGPIPTPLLVDAGSGRTVLGGTNADYGMANGLFIDLGTWLNDRHTVGLGADFLLLQQKTTSASAGSDGAGSPTLFRPFTDALLAQPGQFFVATPGMLSGRLDVATGARFSAAEVYLDRNLAYEPCYSFDFLVGGRYVDLDEFLAVTQTSQIFGVNPLPFGGASYPVTGPTALTVSDRFRTRNQFWGGVLGFKGEYRLGVAFFNLTTKVGMGNTHEVIEIDGSSRLGVPGAPVLPGGLLTGQGANLGRTVTNRFAVLAEVGAQAGVQLTPRLRVTGGYDFLYLNNVARPGGQVDPVVNPRFLPVSARFGSVSGLTSPLPTGVRDDVFVHGVRVGVQFQY